jgi:hypothetical protein
MNIKISGYLKSTPKIFSGYSSAINPSHSNSIEAEKVFFYRNASFYRSHSGVTKELNWRKNDKLNIK